MYKTLTALLLGLSLSAQAVWVESTGTAYIHNGRTEKARQAATEAAIRQALMSQGVKVSSTSTLADGLLTQETTQFDLQGEVQGIRLISEHLHQDKIDVKVQVDVFSTQNTQSCSAAAYRKSVSVLTASIKDREHANVGNLYQLGEKFSSIIHRELTTHSRFSTTKVLSASLSSAYFRGGETLTVEARQALQQMAQANNANYLVIPLLHDISIQTDPGGVFQLWQDDYRRHFIAAIMVYDATQDQIVLNQAYQGEAIWNQDLRRDVQLNSQTFWRSAYGSLVATKASEAAADIDQSLKCMPLTGQITYVEGDKLTINLGKINGVKINQAIQLKHFRQSWRGFTNTNHPTTIEARVTGVYPDHAEISINPQEFGGSLQVRDLVFID